MPPRVVVFAQDACPVLRLLEKGGIGARSRLCFGRVRPDTLGTGVGCSPHIDSRLDVILSKQKHTFKYGR